MWNYFDVIQRNLENENETFKRFKSISWEENNLLRSVFNPLRLGGMVILDTLW